MATAIRPIGHDDRLSLVEHLDELRKRLILCLIAFFVCFGITYWQNDAILDLVNRPLEQTQNLDGEKRSNDPLEQSARFQLELGDALKSTGPALDALRDSLQSLAAQDGVDAATERRIRGQLAAVDAALAEIGQAADAVPTNRERQPVTLGVTEPFLTTFSVSAYAALLLALPFLLFQAYAFVLPAFSPAERRAVLPLMLMVPVLFLAGVAFGYLLALPRAVDFLQNFNDDDFDILVQARDYYRFSIVLLAVIGFLFQIPVGVLAVTRLGIVTPAQLARNRGYVLLGIAVVAAVATPTPDPFTMVIAMAPLVVLFELSVVMARVFERRRGPGRDRWRWEDDDEEDELEARGDEDAEDEDEDDLGPDDLEPYAWPEPEDDDRPRL